MNIVSTRVDELVQRLARATGEDVEIAITGALEERLSRYPTPSIEARRGALQAFFDLATQTPIKDTRSFDEIVGYGPDGLPR